jgi:hypothetical protein
VFFYNQGMLLGIVLPLGTTRDGPTQLFLKAKKQSLISMASQVKDVGKSVVAAAKPTLNVNAP